MTSTNSPTDQQLDEYAKLAITAEHDGIKVAPAVVTVLVDEVRRLQFQSRFLLRQLAKKDATSGGGALREFLAGPDSICGDPNDGDCCELEPGHQGHHRADTAEWSAAVEAPDPLAYGPTGITCGCGKDAHSNLVPCQPDTVASIGSINIRSESIQLDNGECLRDLAVGDSVELRPDTGHEGLWIAAAFQGDFQERITLQYAEVVEDCGSDPALACEFSGTRHAHPVDLAGKVRPRPAP